MIVGIDEVGRGPWAGPLVVGAVVLGDIKIEGLTDSKKLSALRREQLAKEIYTRARAVGLGWVQASELDEIGMSASLVEATKRAIAQITVSYHEIIIDGTVNFLESTGKGPYVTTMKKADLLIGSVSAASIVAKVARDDYMLQQAAIYPEYGFESHVGYGTAKHRAAIDKHGITPLHRLSFAPLQKYQVPTNQPPSNVVTTASTKLVGDHAEEVVADYLRRTGHDILERNWKTKFCEIDIVSIYDGTTYFTEVKFRKNLNQGGGMGAITPKKLKQMKFAAQLYSTKLTQSTDMRLCAASVDKDMNVEQWLPLE